MIITVNMIMDFIYLILRLFYLEFLVDNELKSRLVVPIKPFRFERNKWVYVDETGVWHSQLYFDIYDEFIHTI